MIREFGVQECPIDIVIVVKMLLRRLHREGVELQQRIGCRAEPRNRILGRGPTSSRCMGCCGCRRNPIQDLWTTGKL
jgi:hypothetical protein